MEYIKQNRRYLLCLFAGVACCMLLNGCTAKNSGLYQVSVGEDVDTASVVDKAEPDRAEEDSSDAGAGSIESMADTGAGDGAGTAGADVSSDPAEADEPQTIYVHVCGAVKAPGVYEMQPGDRIFNAVDAAEGFTEDAATDYVNLAQEVADGMKITIPTAEEAEAMAVTVTEAVEYADSTDASIDGGGSAGGGSIGSGGGLININTADESSLTSITGIGPTRARAIIAYREEHGPFARTEDIRNVSGIGDSTYNKMKDEITVQ